MFVTCKPSCGLVVLYMDMCVILWELYCTNVTLINAIYICLSPNRIIMYHTWIYKGMVQTLIRFVNQNAYWFYDNINTPMFLSTVNPEKSVNVISEMDSPSILNSALGVIFVLANSIWCFVLTFEIITYLRAGLPWYLIFIGSFIELFNVIFIAYPCLFFLACPYVERYVIYATFIT